MTRSLVLSRPKLMETILGTILECSLTAIVAPMGYGKTTLAHALTASPEVGHWYYSVSDGPHDAHFLWHDMCESFDTQGMTGILALQRLGFPQAASQMRRVGEFLRGLDTPVLLILDDYHLVTDPVMDRFWENVARMEIPGLHIVLFSRTRPGMNLEELGIKRLAAVIEQDALAFSEAETEAYFRLNGVDDPEAAVTAWRYSEGWPAALWLYLQNGQARGQVATAPDIDSLLANSVFLTYDAGERDLLLRLSVFEDFTEQEAGKIAGIAGIALRLRTLRDKNAFLSFDASSGRYKFHSIFRDFLRKELVAAPDIDRAALYRFAGECCEERGEFVLAFRFYLQAGRDEDLVRLLGLFMRMEEDASAVYFSEELFEKTYAIPERIRLQCPIGYLRFVISACIMWNDHRTASLLDEAEELFTAAPQLPEYLKHRLLGEIRSLRGALNFCDMEKMWEHFAAARRLLNGSSILHSQATATTFGNPSMAFIFLREPGRYAALVKCMEQNLHLYHTLSNGIGMDLDKVFRAEFLLDCGNLAAAEAVLREVLRVSGRADGDKQIGVFLSASFLLARVYAASNRAAAALPLLDGFPARVENLILEHRDCADMITGYISAILGKLDSIPQWLREGEVFDPPHCYIPQVFGFSFTVYAKSLLLQENYQELAAMLSRLPTCAMFAENLYVRIHRAILHGIASWHTQGRSTAIAFIKEALELAQPDGIVLPLAEYGAHILPFLRLLDKQGELGMPHCKAVFTLAGRMAQVADSMNGGRQKGLLTPRELELMRYAAQGASNPAIAKSIGVSIDAVKKVLSRAYGKLEATGRVDAVRRFNEIYGN